MLGTSAELIAEDLRRYGEDDTASWVLGCSDDELVRICSVADWLTLHGPAQRSGASMMLAKACALAAVYVREGEPRDLARKTRKPVDPDATRPASGSGRWPDHELQSAAPRHYGVGDDAKRYWAGS